MKDYLVKEGVKSAVINLGGIMCSVSEKVPTEHRLR